MATPPADDGVHLRIASAVILGSSNVWRYCLFLEKFLEQPPPIHTLMSILDQFPLNSSLLFRNVAQPGAHKHDSGEIGGIDHFASGCRRIALKDLQERQIVCLERPVDLVCAHVTPGGNSRTTSVLLSCTSSFLQHIFYSLGSSQGSCLVLDAEVLKRGHIETGGHTYFYKAFDGIKLVDALEKDCHLAHTAQHGTSEALEGLFKVAHHIRVDHESFVTPFIPAAAVLHKVPIKPLRDNPIMEPLVDLVDAYGHWYHHQTHPIWYPHCETTYFVLGLVEKIQSRDGAVIAALKHLPWFFFPSRMGMGTDLHRQAFAHGVQRFIAWVCDADGRKLCSKLKAVHEAHSAQIVKNNIPTGTKTILQGSEAVESIALLETLFGMAVV